MKMTLSTLLLASLVSLSLARPIVPVSVDADKSNVNPLAKRNPNQIQWCKDTNFNNCELQQ